MTKNQLCNKLLDQSSDLIWIINSKFRLVYANKAYLNLVKEVTGNEKILNESVFVEGFGEGYTQRWRAYYERALSGETFKIEEHFHHPETNEIQYNQVTIKPVSTDDNEITEVACQSQNITQLVQQRSEANQLMDASLDVFCTIDEDGNFTFVSEASTRHWGYTPDELKGMPFRPLILKEDLEKTDEIAAAIMGGAEVRDFVNRYRKKGGGIAYNLWSARWDDETKLMYGVARDGREQVEKEELILQSEQRFKALVQEGSDLIAILDTEGVYQYVSPTSTSVLGIPPEEFIEKNAFDFIHPDDVERVKARMQQLDSFSSVKVEPFRFPNHKNEWRWIETVFTNMLDNPAVRGIVANSRDITEKIEEDERRKLLESVITNTKDAVLITEADPLDEPGPRIIYVNEAFTKMTGYTAEEVIGKTPRILQGPNSDREALTELGKNLRNRESSEITTINYKKNGEELWINFSVTPVANENGNYTHYIAIERDVTEQKNRELETELIAKISTNFNLYNDYGKAITEMCKTVGLYGKFDWVELWTRNLEKSKMQLTSHFVFDSENESFYAQSNSIKTFSKGEGLIGEAWQNRKQVLIDDAPESTTFIRKVSARSIGLKSALGIPLRFNDEVLGVLALGTKREASYLKRFSPLFKRLENFIGSEIQRKILENDLRHLFDAIPYIVSVGDFQGKFLRINKAGCQLLGYSEEEILKQGFEKFIHPDDLEIAYQELGQLETGQTTFAFEVRFITKSGEILWLSWYCNASVDDGLIYSTAKNITEEKKLRELNRQTRQLAKIGSWEVDLINQKLYWTEEVHQMHETDPNSFVPDLETAINFYREDFREMVKAGIDRAINTGEPFDLEAVIVTANKREVWVRAIGNAEFVDGTCRRFFGSFQDIHERKEAEIRLQSLGDNLPGVVFQYYIYTDGTSTFKSVSKGAQEVVGFAADEVMQNNQLIWNQILAGGDFDTVQKSISESVETKSRWSAQWKYTMPNGEIRTHAGYGSPSTLADGTVVFNSLILDVTKEAKNEEMLEQITQMARVGSWDMELAGKEGDSMYWSPIMKEILEVDENFDSSLSECLELCTNTSEAQTKKAMKALIEKGVEFDEELLFLTAKGNKKWVRVLGKSDTVSGKSFRVYGSFQDIHEIKSINEDLQKAVKERTSILESIGDGFFTVDNQWIVTYWNKQAESALGLSREEVIGKNLWKVFPDVLDTEFYSQYHEAKKSGKAVSFEEYYEALGIWFAVSAYPSNEGLSVYFTDVTDKKEFQKELLIANERFEKATEATRDVIWDWDIVNDTFYRSNAIERFFGKETPKFMTENNFWRDSFHPEDLDELQKNVEEAIVNPSCSHWESEYRIFNEKGQIHYIVDKGLIIRNASGKAIRMIGAMTDVTEQKNFEVQLKLLNQELQSHARELERSNEELEQFAFITSHDLQEPLRMVSSFMNQLSRKYENQLDEKAKQYIHFATDGAKRMKQIIMDLLEYSRAGRPTESMEEVDLNDLLSEFKLLRRKLISEKSVTISAPELPTIYTYKAAITQVLHSLLDNAIKYSKKGVAPSVEITVEENKDNWTFAIADNGIGIDAEFFDQIFIIFQRLHNRDEYEGTGIGLSIAKRHIEFLGGKVWLESALGEGTTFYFTIAKED